MLAALRVTSHLSALTGMACIGSGAAGCFGGLSPRASAQFPTPGARAIAREHWKYGRWLFASTLVAFGIPDLQTIMLSVLVDLKSAGALRALMNFVLRLTSFLLR